MGKSDGTPSLDISHYNILSWPDKYGGYNHIRDTADKIGCVIGFIAPNYQCSKLFEKEGK